MKTLKNISIICLISLLISSCSSNSSSNKKSSSDLLPPLSIEIPSEVQGDKDLVELIKKSEKAINEFSDNVEILIEDLQPIAENLDEGEDLNTFEQLKVGKALLEFGTHSVTTVGALEAFNNYVELKEEAGETLNDEQLKAIAIVKDAFEKRMNEIDEKFSKLSKKIDK